MKEWHHIYTSTWWSLHKQSLSWNKPMFPNEYFCKCNYNIIHNIIHLENKPFKESSQLWYHIMLNETEARCVFKNNILQSSGNFKPLYQSKITIPKDHKCIIPKWNIDHEKVTTPTLEVFFISFIISKVIVYKQQGHNSDICGPIISSNPSDSKLNPTSWTTKARDEHMNTDLLLHSS